MSEKKKKQNVIAKKYSKILFNSELMLGNKKYVNGVVVVDTLYLAILNMLDEFDKNDYNSDLYQKWLEIFRNPLFILKELDDPYFYKYHRSLVNILKQIVEEYKTI